MDSNVKTLVKAYTKALKQRTAAVFVGAGLSKASGFVDWRGLLRHIGEELHLDTDKEQDLVALTQFHINEKGGNRSAINQTLVDEFTADCVCTRNHEIVARLPIDTFWTTNYDTLIEDALRDAGKTPDVKITQENLATSWPHRDAIVYKMHGDISQPQNAVISKDDYEAYSLHRPLFSTALQGDLVSKTFLFLGFSFNDPNLDHILGRIRVLLGENQREHFCLFRTVHSEDYCTSQDYEYDKIKQALRIKDLKRYSINGILVDNYSDMTEILTKIENSFRRNTVFVSGSAHEYGKWGTDNSLKFMHTLASRLSSKEYRIVSGFGLGVGTAVINGCLDYVYSSNYRHLDEYLVLRPFPQIATGAKSKEKLWEEYRRDMMTEAGTAVFLFGHKANVDGKPVDADGVYKEFDIARKLRLKPIPVGATGFASKRLWEKVMSEFDTFYADYPQLRPDFEVLGKEDESHDKLIGTILKILDAIRGG